MEKEANDNQDEKSKFPPVTLGDLPEVMQAAVARVGWKELTPVQAGAIPFMRAGVDLMAQARTGSGKTGAFILPLLERIDTSKKACQALVLVPTRELAQQVSKDAKALAGDSGMRTVSVYGGSSYKPQLEGFKRGAHLVVGTPGRVLDHLIKRNLKLDQLEMLIYDEADRMMSMGFYPDMLQVQQFLPDRRVNGYMFSATFPVQVKRLAGQFLDNPDFLSLSQDQVHVGDTRHQFYLTPGMDKDRALVRIIEMENPTQTIIFCNTKDRVYYVTRVLQRFGYNADQLSSDLSQNLRDKVLTRVREGKLRFLVATDVAARGIDIPDLSHVIQYEPPDELEAYIHRAGRTGRAGASGVAIMLVNHNEKKHITRLSAHYNIEFEERRLPSNEDVQTLVSQRLTGQLEARLRERDKLQTERMARFAPLVEQLSENEDGLALLTMLLDDTYHDWMHEAPELPPVGSQATPKKSISKRERHRRRDGRQGKGGGKRDGGGRKGSGGRRR
jgi:ATP-dependent RNA helicase DeaD